MASKRLRIVWAAAGVLAVFGALFAAVVLLPLLALAAVVAHRMSRRADGPTAYLWPVGLLALVAVAPWFQRFMWQSAVTPGPNPVAPEWWALSSVESLVWADPFYAGVTLPVLIVLVPLALGVAIMIALVRP